MLEGKVKSTRPALEACASCHTASTFVSFPIMKHRLPYFLVLSTFLFAAPVFGAQQTPSCADKSIVASAVRTTEDVQAFVQCAYEFVQEVGFEAARRAFHEDPQWRSGPTYISVSEVTPVPGAAHAFVFPPDGAREGTAWGPLVDEFGSDLIVEAHRVVSSFGEGWIYYSFTNPATGRDEPKASYEKGIDWDGTPASIGAGIYRNDLPGTCEPGEVHALGLAADPSNPRLAAFVRCAAMELESQGYFAVRALSSDPRWRSRSIYLFGLDTYGNTLFSGDPYSQWFGALAPELNAHREGAFGGRDVIAVGDAFGETFFYYTARNPATGRLQRKVTFVKRVVVYGLPILVGAGIYTDCPPGGCAVGADAVAAACETARQTLADFPAMRVQYGFYTDFNPVSYSVAPGAAAHRPRGYEPDLVAAVETLSRGRLSFTAVGIGNPFSGIWLKAAQEPYDMVGGGITALPERTRDAEGRPVIRFGVGHISFAQSLLVRATSAIDRHDDLTSEHRVGTYRGTTGEKRLLELTGIIDTAGFIRSGTRLLLADGRLLTAGEPDSESALRIAAGTGSAAIATRIRLTPAGDDQPEVLYFDSDGEQTGALLEGAVDALAGDEFGNRVTARDTPGLRVTAIAESNERGAFSYPDTRAGNALRRTMNAAISCLTANGTIGFGEWFDSGGTIFAQRARQP